jgi:uncharacterized protein
MSKNEIGAITWMDLTVQNADQIRDFYQAVVGWKPDAVDMGGYSDYNMSSPETKEPKAGVCHARGGNADLPAQWLIYITVANLDESMENCRREGGKIISGPRSVTGHGRYCVIQDPAGAVAALFEKV